MDDLSQLDTTKGAAEGFELQLRHPETDAPLPLWVTVIGADSDEYHAAVMKQQRKRMERLKGHRRMNLSPEELQEEAIELLVGATRSWRGEMKLDGKDFPAYTPAAAKQLYKRFKWMREQVDAAMGDRANFLPRSATP